MRFFIPLVIILIANVSFGQNIEGRKKAIDVEVNRISKEIKLPTINFSIQALKKVLHYINYEYVTNPIGYIKIKRRFSYKNDTIHQTFFLQKGDLIYATEEIVTYFTKNKKTDSIAWRGDFYFSKGKLIDHVTVGHGKSEIDSWNPEQEMLAAFNESKRDIDRYKKMKY